MVEPQLVDKVLGALLAPGTWTGTVPAAVPADSGRAPLLPGPCIPTCTDGVLNMGMAFAPSPIR